MTDITPQSGIGRLWAICFVVTALRMVPAYADSLTERVVAAFNHEDPKLQAGIKSDDAIHLTTRIGPITVFLDRVRAECQRRPENCGGTIKQLVSSTTATAAVSHVPRLASLKFEFVREVPGILAGITL